MKKGYRETLFFILGMIAMFAVQKYAIYEHQRIKKTEQEALKQKIKRENEILIRRLEEDFQTFKDSIDQVFIKKKKQLIAE